MVLPPILTKSHGAVDNRLRVRRRVSGCWWRFEGSSVLSGQFCPFASLIPFKCFSASRSCLVVTIVFDLGLCYNITVAPRSSEWIEHLPAKQEVAGSSPVEG